jgi:hypothetical protein
MIYVDINGSWGPADELETIDDSTWTHKDYEEMSMWTDSMVVGYSETHNGMTPTEWVQQTETGEKK